MPNASGKAYGLSIYCPIQNKSENNQSYSALVRTALQNYKEDDQSPMATVPNTYLSRFYIINDTIFQGSPHERDSLKSSYLAFTANFHGDRDTYLKGMYNSMKEEIHSVWKYCYAFDQVKDAESFIKYIDKVQVDTTYFFVGSNDDSLEEQLKSLYLKQEFSRFAFANQGKTDEELLLAYKEFVAKTQPKVLSGPTWVAGAGSLKKINTK